MGWTYLGRAAAANNRRQVLHAARRILSSADGSRYVASGAEWLALCPGATCECTPMLFEYAATTARSSKEPAVYRAALDLYTGDLLPEDRYEAWAEDRCEELRQLYLTLLLGLAKLLRRLAPG